MCGAVLGVAETERASRRGIKLLASRAMMTMAMVELSLDGDIMQIPVEVGYVLVVVLVGCSERPSKGDIACASELNNGLCLTLIFGRESRP